MVFACCFGGGGEAPRGPSQVYGAGLDKAITSANARTQEFTDLQGGTSIRVGTTTQSEKATLINAETPKDSNAAYQLNILSAALAGLSGSWYERVSSAASRLTSASGAALCSISILDGAQDRFIVVHVNGEDPECSVITPPGSHMPALQAIALPASSATSNAAPGSSYSSVQVLQLIQAPLLYSYSDPLRASRGTNQPPHDWHSAYEAHGLSEFCAVPLINNKLVVGAVTLSFHASSGRQQPHGQQHRGPTRSTSAAAASLPLMSCDEQSLRTLGLLLSVLLVGQDMQLAQQVADILGGVFDARNLQQIVPLISGGAEQVLQLTTRVAVSTNIAILVAPNSGSSNNTLAAGGVGNGSVSGVGSSGRAIFFEERNGSSGDTQGTAGSRSMQADVYSTSCNATNSQIQTHRTRMQRSHADGQGGNAAPAGGTGSTMSPRAKGGSNTSAAAPQTLRNYSVSNDNISPANGGGGSHGGLLWQEGLVQARALGLRHTLLASLPVTGTIVNDCAAYMQQVGCPKRDLYLLSACQGTPPYSLAIAPAPFKEGDCMQLVLYVAVATRLPSELLNSLLGQAQLLAVHVLSPVLQQKLLHGNLADEWALLLGKCSSGRSTTGMPAAVGNAAAVDPEQVPSTGNAAGLAVKDAPSEPLGLQQTGSIGTCDRPSSAGASGRASEDMSGAIRGRQPQQPQPASAGNVPEALQSAEASRSGPTDLANGGSSLKVSSTPAVSLGPQATVLSTAVGGAFAGDTRTHMGMLVASFKDTINALQATRTEEAEELSVLKLGKVLGRGGSGLVFQGYLHLGLEVAVKLFENPDDTDPDAISQEDATALDSNPNGSAASIEAGASKNPASNGDAAQPNAGCADCSAKDAAAATGSKSSAKDGGKDGSQHTVAARANSSKTAAQMAKRQRDLLRNALELGVTSSLSHPNIVQGYCHWVNVVLMQDASLNRCWLMGQADYMALAPPGSPQPPLCSALVMEYCDMGSLIHALKRGTFTGPETKPNMEFIYMCLLEIALALRHLHTAKLAHCDLKPGNVLLRSSPRDPRGFVCKLGDFGYAAILKDGLVQGRPAMLPDEACGTLQYMAPELFVAGRPVDASIDIYAFGMLMWELITGKTPYSDQEYGSRALMKSVYHGKRPVFPETTLPTYKNLAMCCWSGDPNMRPNATVLVKLLRQQLESFKHSSANPSPNTSRGA